MRKHASGDSHLSVSPMRELGAISITGTRPHADAWGSNAETGRSLAFCAAW
jgi:hypothetical protein